MGCDCKTKCRTRKCPCRDRSKPCDPTECIACQKTCENKPGQSAPKRHVKIQQPATTQAATVRPTNAAPLSDLWKKSGVVHSQNVPEQLQGMMGVVHSQDVPDPQQGMMGVQVSPQGTTGSEDSWLKPYLTLTEEEEARSGFEDVDISDTVLDYSQGQTYPSAQEQNINKNTATPNVAQKIQEKTSSPATAWKNQMETSTSSNNQRNTFSSALNELVQKRSATVAQNKLEPTSPRGKTYPSAQKQNINKQTASLNVAQKMQEQTVSLARKTQKEPLISSYIMSSALNELGQKRLATVAQNKLEPTSSRGKTYPSAQEQNINKQTASLNVAQKMQEQTVSLARKNQKEPSSNNQRHIIPPARNELGQKRSATVAQNKLEPTSSKAITIDRHVDPDSINIKGHINPSTNAADNRRHTSFEAQTQAFTQPIALTSFGKASSANAIRHAGTKRSQHSPGIDRDSGKMSHPAVDGIPAAKQAKQSGGTTKPNMVVTEPNNNDTAKDNKRDPQRSSAAMAGKQQVKVKHGNQKMVGGNIYHLSDTATDDSDEEREENECDTGDQQTETNFCDFNDSLNPEPVDIYPMPKEMLHIHPHETQVKNSYFPIQEFLAQDIINRISLILSPEYKLERNIDSENTSLCPSPIPTSLDGFEGFDFRIYTARSVMLRDQTIARLCQREMACFPEELYNNPIELYKEGEKKVKTYQLTKGFKKDFTEFKKQAEQNPKMLHLVIADEAHWGSDASTEKVDRANEKFVNSWKNDIHGNVIVLQVTATPFNLLSTNTRLPSEKYCANRIDDNELILVQEKAKRLMHDKTDVTRTVGPKNDLHHVRWSESLRHRLEQGIVVTLQIPQKRSRGSFDQVWLEVRNKKLCKSQNPKPSELTINGKNGIVSVRHEGNILAAINHDSGTSLEFIDENDSNGKCTEFNIFLEYGEDVFQLSARTETKHKNFLKYCTKEECMILDRKPTETYKELGGLKFVQDIHYLMVIGICKASQLGTLNTKSKRYLSLTFYYNSIRNKEKDEQLIRYDEDFSDLSKKSEVLKNNKNLDGLLASEYAFFILSNEGLRSLMLHISSYERLSIPKTEFVSWITKIHKLRDERTKLFAKNLDENKEQVEPENNLKLIFEEVIDNLKNIPQRSIHRDVYIRLMKSIIYGQDFEIDQDCPEMLEKDQLQAAFDVCLKESETLKIVNDLIQDQSALKNGLKGKMKIIRATGVENGNKIYKILCQARQVAGGTDKNYMFEIIRDYDNFKICDINNEQKDETSALYRIRQVLQTNDCQHVDDESREMCQCKRLEYESKSLTCKNCNHRHKSVRQYSDLENLPCILILVEKGRMGDTFPSSFNTMDLRLHFQDSRNPPYFNSIVQELGRLCRYSEEMALNKLPYVLIGKYLYENFKNSLDTSAVYYGYVEQKPGLLDRRLKANNKAGGKGADVDNETKHYNRILLSAEPQIGKTGTYLKLISLIRNKIIRRKVKPQIALEECSVGDEELSDDSTGNESDDETIQGSEQDKSEFWLYPYHKMFEHGILKAEISCKSKYYPIYGPYKHRKVPTNRFPPKYMRKETNRKSKKKGKETIGENLYRPMTRDHTCPTCMIEGMNSHEIEITIKKQSTSISIPNSRHYQMRVMNTLDRLSSETSKNPKTGNELESWIFTPTYGRATTGSVNLCKTMRLTKGTSCEFIHVLVVKPEEYEEYCLNWRTTHAILKLPETMEGADVHEGGVGYSRRFIQLFAEKFNLDTIFMIDDNFAAFKEVREARDQLGFIVERNAHDGTLETKNVPLYGVLKHLENIGSENHFVVQNTYTPKKECKENTISSYTGPLSEYGIVGMLKMREGSLRVTKPFKQTHVYSLVLVNIKALKAKGVKYKPWPVFEDLNMNNDADIKGLNVVKFSRFFMVKRNLKSWISEICTYSLEDFIPDDSLPMAQGWYDKLFRWLRCNARPDKIKQIETKREHIDNNHEEKARCLIKKLGGYTNRDHNRHQILITNVEGWLDEETMKSSILDKIKPDDKCNTMVMLTSAEMQIFGELLTKSEYDCMIVSSHNISEYSVPYVLLHIQNAKYEYQEDMDLSTDNSVIEIDTTEAIASCSMEQQSEDISREEEMDTQPDDSILTADVDDATCLHGSFQTWINSAQIFYNKIKDLEEENTKLKKEIANLKDHKLPIVGQNHLYGCNVCGNENMDTFFHCILCKDYDICVECMNTTSHQHPVLHVVLKPH
ncbi:unnamed protein product [Owenia fusiformis]|uniref:Uncharacterized protein n=1 Tax=Owenia fusiformis TaxID=6347 RepID=A0A8J1TMK0_OWEFU|nr:unnamed protein product [Owenia fusiformis]